MHKIIKFDGIVIFIFVFLLTTVNMLSGKKPVNVTKPSGHRNRIVGGHRCSIKNHPYMVSVRHTIDNRHFCGGSLVSRFWVLTAAHCCAPIYERGKYTVVAGVSERAQKGKSSLVYQCYRHQDYYDADNYNDIALLNLEFPIKESRSVRYIKLPDDADVEEDLQEICSKSLVLGWGDQYAKDIHEEPLSTPVPKQNPFLQCVILPLVSHRHCESKYLRKMPDTVICAYSKNQDSCQNDSGGPLICHGVQYGIVSFGIGCAYKDVPGVYTRVDKFQSFIRGTITRNCSTKILLEWLYISSWLCLSSLLIYVN